MFTRFISFTCINVCSLVTALEKFSLLGNYPKVVYTIRYTPKYRKASVSLCTAPFVDVSILRD